MTTEELIAGYKKIIESMSTMVDHSQEAVRNNARNQITRCEKAIKELEALLPTE